MAGILAHRRKIIVSAVALAVLASVVAALVELRGARDAAAVQLRPGDAAIVARGEQLYARHCAACHGADLEGQPDWRRRGPDDRLPAPPHDASGHTWHHPDHLLVTLTREGPAALAGGSYASNMPAYGGILEDAEIVAVLSYIKSTWPPEIRARHDQLNRAASDR
jgi:mono/diheme cytochrome c family protein